MNIPEMDEMTWMKYGWERGWVGPPVCYLHDGLPMTADELEDWSNGADPCMTVIRVYNDHEHRLGVEYNDSPTNWRASNLGWKKNLS